MKALVLEEKGKLSLRDFPIIGTLGRRMCGSKRIRSGSAGPTCITIRMENRPFRRHRTDDFGT